MKTVSLAALVLSGINLGCFLFYVRLLIKMRKQHKAGEEVINILRMSTAKAAESMRDLLIKKVYLVFLTGEGSALVGCFSDEQKAKNYLDGKEGIVQEIEIQ